MTILLMMVTLTLYIPYWLYTRTRILNTLCPQKPIPTLFMAFCIGGYIVLMVMSHQLPEAITMDELISNPEFYNFVLVASLVGMLQLIWIILFCQRLNLCTGVTKNDPLYANYAILVISNALIANVYYLQYKINQINDSGQKHNPIIGLM